MLKKRPNQNVKLFIEETSTESGAWLKTPASQKYLYSEGYWIAGETIYNSIKTGNNNSNILVYPLLFNFRQYVELILKELIQNGIILLGKKYKKTNKKDLKQEHGLIQLWEIFKDVVIQINFTYDYEYETIAKLINQFHQEDPTSTSFRYPYDHKPSAIKDTIDLENFKNNMDTIYNFLEGIRELMYLMEENNNEYD